MTPQVIVSQTQSAPARGAVEVTLAGGRDEVVAGRELVLAVGQAEAPAALEQQELLPARVAVPVRDRPLVKVHARDVGAPVRLGGLQHLELHAPREAPAVGLAPLALLHDSHAADPSRA